MQKSDIKNELSILEKSYKDILSMIDLETLKENIKILDQQTYDQTFWNDASKAQKIVKN